MSGRGDRNDKGDMSDRGEMRDSVDIKDRGNKANRCNRAHIAHSWKWDYSHTHSLTYSLTGLTCRDASASKKMLLLTSQARGRGHCVGGAPTVGEHRIICRFNKRWLVNRWHMFKIHFKIISLAIGSVIDARASEGRAESVNDSKMGIATREAEEKCSKNDENSNLGESSHPGQPWHHGCPGKIRSFHIWRPFDGWRAFGGPQPHLGDLALWPKHCHWPLVTEKDNFFRANQKWLWNDWLVI